MWQVKVLWRWWCSMRPGNRRAWHDKYQHRLMKMHTSSGCREAGGAELRAVAASSAALPKASWHVAGGVSWRGGNAGLRQKLTSTSVSGRNKCCVRECVRVKSDAGRKWAAASGKGRRPELMAVITCIGRGNEIETSMAPSSIDPMPMPSVCESWQRARAGMSQQLLARIKRHHLYIPETREKNSQSNAASILFAARAGEMPRPYEMACARWSHRIRGMPRNGGPPIKARE